MNLSESYKKRLRELSGLVQESSNSEQVKQLMIQGNDIETLIKALSIVYGSHVPLYHATSVETAELIDKEGLKLTYGKNYKSFSDEMNLYFQIGRSDYQSSDRPIVYKWMAPLEFIEKYAYADMDNINVGEDDLIELGINPDNLSSDFRDFLMSFIWNDYSFDGMELLIENRDIDSGFPDIRPERID